jgi:hypothetical protein
VRGEQTQPADVLQDPVERLAVDELHGVVMSAFALADAEDRDNVGVVQPGRGLRLAAEALQVGALGHQVAGEDLEGDVPAKRFLQRLVDHAHAAASHLAEDAILAEAVRRFGPGCFRGAGAAQVLDELVRQRGQRIVLGGRGIHGLAQPTSKEADLPPVPICPKRGLDETGKRIISGPR